MFSKRCCSAHNEIHLAGSVLFSHRLSTRRSFFSPFVYNYVVASSACARELHLAPPIEFALFFSLRTHPSRAVYARLFQLPHVPPTRRLSYYSVRPLLFAPARIIFLLSFDGRFIISIRSCGADQSFFFIYFLESFAKERED